MEFGGLSYSKTFLITWPDATKSEVVLAQDPMGYAEVRISGHRARLAALADYKTPGAVETELAYIVLRHKGKIVAVQGDN